MKEIPETAYRYEEPRLDSILDGSHVPQRMADPELLIAHFHSYFSKIEEIMVRIYRAIEALGYFENDYGNFFDSETLACLVS